MASDTICCIEKQTGQDETLSYCAQSLGLPCKHTTDTCKETGLSLNVCSSEPFT